MTRRTFVRKHRRRTRAGRTTVGAHTRNRAGDAIGAPEAKRAAVQTAKAAKAKNSTMRRTFLKRAKEDVDNGLDEIAHATTGAVDPSVGYK